MIVYSLKDLEEMYTKTKKEIAVILVGDDPNSRVLARFVFNKKFRQSIDSRTKSLDLKNS